jgi:regulator of RNase E activity RraA
VNTAKFKIGDRVRIVRILNTPHDNEDLVGALGTIMCVENQPWPYEVQLDHDKEGSIMPLDEDEMVFAENGVKLMLETL